MQTIQQKIQKAEEYKAEGNQFFKAGNFSRAKANYGKCLAYCTGLAGSARNKTGYENFQKKDVNIIPVTEEEEATAAQLELICHQNIATCFLKMHAPSDALSHCQKALRLNGGAWKALLRQGECYLQLGRLDEAKTIFENLLDTTTDAAVAATIKKHLTVVKNLLKDHTAKEKKRYKNMFSDSNQQQQQQVDSSDSKEEGEEEAPTLEEQSQEEEENTKEEGEESHALKLQKMIEKEFNGK